MKYTTFTILFILIAIFPIYPKYSISNIIIVATGLLSFIFLFIDKAYFKKIYLWVLLPAVMLFVIDLIGGIYADNLKEYLRLLFKSGRNFLLSIALMYACVVYAKNPIVNLQRLKDSYLVSVILWILILYGVIIGTSTLNMKNLNEGILRCTSDAMFNVHGTYVALLIGGAIFLILEKLVTQKMSKIQFFLLLGSLSFLLFSQYFTQAEMPYYATVLLIPIYLLLFWINNKKVTIGVTFFAAIAYLVLVFLVFSDINQYDRKNNLPNGTTYLKHFDQRRVAIYNCSLDVYREASLTEKIIGQGIDNTLPNLKKCYKRYASTDLFPEGQDNYNTHNTYLDMLQGRGALGLLLFISMLLFPVVFAFLEGKDINLLNFSVVIIGYFIITFFTENILYRQYGIIPFQLFYFFMVYNVISNKQISESK